MRVILAVVLALTSVAAAARVLLEPPPPPPLPADCAGVELMLRYSGMEFVMQCMVELTAEM